MDIYNILNSDKKERKYSTERTNENKIEKNMENQQSNIQFNNMKNQSKQNHELCSSKEYVNKNQEYPKNMEVNNSHTNLKKKKINSGAAELCVKKKIDSQSDDYNTFKTINNKYILNDIVDKNIVNDFDDLLFLKEVNANTKNNLNHFHFDYSKNINTTTTATTTNSNSNNNNVLPQSQEHNIILNDEINSTNVHFETSKSDTGKEEFHKNIHKNQKEARGFGLGCNEYKGINRFSSVDNMNTKSMQRGVNSGKEILNEIKNKNIFSEIDVTNILTEDSPNKELSGTAVLGRRGGEGEEEGGGGGKGGVDSVILQNNINNTFGPLKMKIEELKMKKTNEQVITFSPKKYSHITTVMKPTVGMEQRSSLQTLKNENPLVHKTNSFIMNNWSSWINKGNNINDLNRTKLKEMNDIKDTNSKDLLNSPSVKEKDNSVSSTTPQNIKGTSNSFNFTNTNIAFGSDSLQRNRSIQNENNNITNVGRVPTMRAISNTMHFKLPINRNSGTNHNLKDMNSPNMRNTFLEKSNDPNTQNEGKIPGESRSHMNHLLENQENELTNEMLDGNRVDKEQMKHLIHLVQELISYCECIEGSKDKIADEFCKLRRSYNKLHHILKETQKREKNSHFKVEELRTTLSNYNNKLEEIKNTTSVGIANLEKHVQTLLTLNNTLEVEMLTVVNENTQLRKIVQNDQIQTHEINELRKQIENMNEEKTSLLIQIDNLKLENSKIENEKNVLLRDKTLLLCKIDDLENRLKKKKISKENEEGNPFVISSDAELNEQLNGYLNLNEDQRTELFKSFLFHWRDTNLFGQKFYEMLYNPN